MSKLKYNRPFVYILYKINAFISVYVPTEVILPSKNALKIGTKEFSCSLTHSLPLKERNVNNNKY